MWPWNEIVSMLDAFMVPLFGKRPRSDYLITDGAYDEPFVA